MHSSHHERLEGLKTSPKPTLVVWSPFTIEPTISGYKVNEVERIKTLSGQFTVFAFVLRHLGNIARLDTYKRSWFGEIDARIAALPWLDNYGVRVVSRFVAGMIVALTVVPLHCSRRVDVIVARDGVPSLD
jgi:hypothetical protein